MHAEGLRIIRRSTFFGDCLADCEFFKIKLVQKVIRALQRLDFNRWGHFKSALPDRPQRLATQRRVSLVLDFNLGIERCSFSGVLRRFSPLLLVVWSIKLAVVIKFL